jgi:integrase
MPVLNHDFVRALKPQAKPFEVRDAKLKGFLLRVQPSGVMTYYVEYRRGKRKRIGPADALAPSNAREAARLVLAEAALGGDPIAAAQEAKAHTFRSFVDEVYEPWVKANTRAPKATLGRLRANFPDLQHKKLCEINAWLVEKWRAARLKTGAKPVTVNRDLDDLRSVLAKAVAWGLLETHPLVGVKRLRTDANATVRFLDDDEERRLRAALGAREERIRAERDRANAWRAERGYRLLPDLRRVVFADHLKPLVLLSINTGLRRGELFGLTWRHVDLERAILTVAGTPPPKAARPGISRSMTRHGPSSKLGAIRRPTSRVWYSPAATAVGSTTCARGGWACSPTPRSAGSGGTISVIISPRGWSWSASISTRYVSCSAILPTP